MIPITELKRLENENEEQFTWRICQAKDSGKLDLDWEEITNVVNKEFRGDKEETYLGSSAIRKPYQQAKRYFENGAFGNILNEDNYFKELQIQKQEIQKEKQKLFDERTGLNKLLREQSRREELFEIVKRAIDEYEPIRFDYYSTPIFDSEADLIIHLTDIHVGMEIDSPLNKFNTDILVDRLEKYLDEVLDIKETYNAQNAYLVLGGDLIHGLIHLNGRIESKENLIDQIKIAADLIGDFVNDLRKRFVNVYVYSCNGNHSRSTVSKEQAVKGENFDSLIPYILKKNFQNVDNVHIEDNTIDTNIATFTVRGWNCYAAHGDKDSANNVVYNMTKLARRAKYPLPDLCFLGHRHRNGLTTVDEVKVVESGCVDGVDSYAIDCRFAGAPEQTVTVVTEKKKIKALCDIQLD